VLGGAAAGVPAVPAGWTFEGVLLGLVSTVITVGFALVPLRFTASGLPHRPLTALG
jgi:hypothetical protein